MYGTETAKRGPTEQIFHKVVEPSLGNLKLDFYPHHHSIRLHTAFYPQPSHCQLGSESRDSLLRPRTHPLSRQHSKLPQIAKKSTAYQNVPLKLTQSGSVGPTQSVPWSFHSVSQTKELPLLTSRSHEKGGKLISRNARKAMSVCSQYRYLGPARVSQSVGGQDEGEEVKSEQVRRFKEEQKSLDHTRHLKRVSEIATYQHRVDRMYYMCGSRVRIQERYDVDNEELEKLRAFSLARSQSRATSGGGRSSHNRHGYGGGSFTSGNVQADPDLTLDLLSGTVSRSAYLDHNRKEIGDNQDDEKTENEKTENETVAFSKEDDLSNLRIDGRGTKQDKDTLMGGGGDKSSQEENVRNSHENMLDAQEHINDSHEDIQNLGGSSTVPSAGGDTGTANVGNTFVTQEKLEENEGMDSIDAKDNHENLNVEVPLDGGGISDGGRKTPGGDVTSEINNQGGGSDASKDGMDVKDVEELKGEDGKEVGDEILGEGAEDEEANDEEDVEEESEEILLTDRTGDSVTEEGPSESELTEKMKLNHQEVGYGIVLDSTPFHASKKQIYDNTTFENPALKQFEDLATLSKDVPDPGSTTGLLPPDFTPRTDDQSSYISDTSDALISKMEDDLQSKDRLSDNLSRVGHLEDSRLDQDLLGEDNDDEGTKDWDNGVFGEVLNDEERKQKEQMVEKRRKEKAEARERHKKMKKETTGEEKTADVIPRKLNLTDVYSFITARQRMIFQKKFQDLDVDRNGKITLKELSQRMHEWVDKKEIKELMKVFDLNSDKTIDEREFVTVAALNDQLLGREIESERAPLELNLKKLSLHITAYKEIFEMTDQDNSGHLTLDEVMFVISISVGEDIGTDQEVVDYIFRTLDLNENGSVDFIEFLSFIPFFLKLHREIVGRPATFQDIIQANEAVKRAMAEKGARKSKRKF
ncbi:uncharacterized protein [Apostichopus japonicus]|uniref:uncharacterized protein isoform X2 n=1 Tax=Stichopus japonicus TaxID=307972 RepID=UPI003AB2270A